MEPAVFPVARPRIPARLFLTLFSSWVLFIPIFFLPEELGPIRQWLFFVPLLGFLAAGLTIFEKLLVIITTNPKNQIVLTEDTLENYVGRDVTSIPYNDITSIVIGERKSGRVEYLRLESQNRTMMIAGYEHLGVLRNSLACLNRPMMVRRALLGRPQTGMILFFIVSVPIGILLTAMKSNSISTLLMELLCLAIGLSLLILRPLSRRGVALFRIWEWFIGIACLLVPVMGVLSLIAG